MPRIVKKDGRYALFVDDAPFFVLGAQVNNFERFARNAPEGVACSSNFMHANTVEIPVYWEQLPLSRGSSITVRLIPS